MNTETQYRILSSKNPGFKLPPIDGPVCVRKELPSYLETSLAQKLHILGCCAALAGTFALMVLGGQAKERNDVCVKLGYDAYAPLQRSCNLDRFQIPYELIFSNLQERPQETVQPEAPAKDISQQFQGQKYTPYVPRKYTYK